MRFLRVFSVPIFVGALSACSADLTGPDQGSVGFNWQVVSEHQGDQP